VTYTGYEGVHQDELMKLIENGDDKLAKELLARFLILLEGVDECKKHIEDLKIILKNQKKWRGGQAT
jgi:hypothetical protein